MKHTIARLLTSGAAAGSILFSGAAAAIDWNVTGFVRQEISYSLATSENPNNDAGNPFNGRVSPMITNNNFGDGFNGRSPTSVYTAPGNGIRGGLFNAGPTAGNSTAATVDCHYGMARAVARGGATNGTGANAFQRVLGGTSGLIFPGNECGFAPGSNPNPGMLDPRLDGAREKDDINFNTFNSRLEIDVQAKFSREFSGYMKFRAYFDGTRNFTDTDIGNHFQNNPMWGSDRATITEWNSPDAIIDIPAFYVDWNRGPLWLRAGNQVIAWGEAYFFRTMDVANGLDLRRHLTLGPGAEEYQDQRIASPGLRLSYTFNNGWELDSFVQMFQPTILPGQNTPYNLIPTRGGRLDDSIGMEDAENALNYGFRLTMPFTESFTGIVGWVNRRNPDGVFTSVDAPQVHAGFANDCLNLYNNTLNLLSIAGFGNNLTAINNTLGAIGGPEMQFPSRDRYRGTRRMSNGCGSVFAPDPTGTPALQYWNAIRSARLDNTEYLPEVINAYPAAKWAVRDMFGFGDELTYADTMRTVEGFRSSFGPFIQWVGRQFKRENIFMVGGNYIVTMDDPNSLLDQLIIRGEVSITPDKRITNDLRYDFTEVNDIVSALIFEKYHRISETFPATYFVAQWMHRTATDLFGRNLDNNDIIPLGDLIDEHTGRFKPAAFSKEALKPRGTGNANYVVFAFQQPFPNLIWRFDMAVLVDVAGGYLVQPGVRYRPAANWQWDLYATIIESPGADNDTITEDLDWADEFFVRLTYFF